MKLKNILLSSILTLFLFNSVFAETKQNDKKTYSYSKDSVQYSERLEDYEPIFGESFPIHFGIHVFFMTHWLDEGANAAPEGLNIHQFYSTSFPVFDSALLKYEYFQADYDKSTPHTLERDHTVSASFNYKLLTIKPSWTYVDIPEDKDSGEIGLELSLDFLLTPYFAVNYDYQQEKGYYCEWGLSHDFDFEKWGILTPSMATGLNSNKGTDSTFLTHIDWGIGYSFPIVDHLTLVSFIHVTKGFKKNKGYEDIVPWGGFAIDIEL